jgi:hypothetical protein
MNMRMISYMNTYAISYKNTHMISYVASIYEHLCNFIYEHTYQHTYDIICVTPHRGYTHCDPETDSDGDGGARPKLRGHGHIEFSSKGIPHGSLHFPEQVRWAGHLFMFDTCAPEAAHKFNIKQPMDRVRKLDERKTASSMMDWTLQSRTWGKITRQVRGEFCPPKEKREYRIPDRLEVRLPKQSARIHRPSENVRALLEPNTFSPLAEGQDRLLSPAVRVSYAELGSLISRAMRWPIRHVTRYLKVKLYCSVVVRHPNGDVKTYWSTDTQYPYLGGHRRDIVQVSLSEGTQHMKPYSGRHMIAHMNSYMDSRILIFI